MGLTKLGWNAERDEQFAPHLAKGFVPARVAVEDKHFYRVWTAEAELSAQVTGKFIHESRRKFIRRSELSIPAGKAQPATSAASNGASIPDDVTVLLLDSIGELASLYQHADGAFVGGSLVEAGGHNILEPAAFGKIPVFGPSMENFAEMASRFVAAKAAVQVESPEDAGVAWIELLRDPERQRAMSETAKRLVDESRGATARAMEEIAKYLGPSA